MSIFSDSGKVRIAPSILAADFTRLGEEIRLAEDGGADMIHIDIMDGHYVPNLSMGPHIVEAVKSITKLPLDVHLMIMNPEKYISSFYNAGADILTIHLEAAGNRTREILEMIASYNIFPALSINPNTDINMIYPYCDLIDMLLIMTVFPGFGGQKFIPSTLESIFIAKQWALEYNFDIEVDGGINFDTGKEVLKAGANILVAGTFVFKSKDIRSTIRKLKELNING